MVLQLTVLWYSGVVLGHVCLGLGVLAWGPCCSIGWWSQLRPRQRWGQGRGVGETLFQRGLGVCILWCCSLPCFGTVVLCWAMFVWAWACWLGDHDAQLGFLVPPMGPCSVNGFRLAVSQYNSCSFIQRPGTRPPPCLSMWLAFVPGRLAETHDFLQRYFFFADHILFRFFCSPDPLQCLGVRACCWRWHVWPPW